MNKYLSQNIFADYKRTWYVWIVLCIGMLPMWGGGYFMYILVGLTPLIFKYYRLIDFQGVFIILFSVIYTGSLLIMGFDYTLSSLIFDILFPFLMYLSGRYIVYRQHSQLSFVILVSTMAICLALPAIVDNVIDAIDSGELINVTRAIEKTTGTSRSATGYGMMLSVMIGCGALLIVAPQNRADRMLLKFFIFVSIGAIFSTIHLVNRTGLVILIVSLFTCVLLPPISTKKLLYTLCSILILIAVLYIFMSDSFLFVDALDTYMDRDDEVGSVSSYGGRSERWLAAINQLIETPLGNKDGLIWQGRHNYAHNLWLDVGIKGGVACMIILIALTIKFLSDIVKLYKSRYYNQFELTLIVIITVSVMLQSMVEPVIDGVPQFFWFTIFLMSAVSSLNKKYSKLLLSSIS